MWMLRMRKMMMLRRKTDTKTGKHTLPEPAQSKRTWTFEKSHFVRKFTGKMPHAPATTSIKHLNPYHKNPFSVATLFGEKIRAGRKLSPRYRIYVQDIMEDLEKYCSVKQSFLCSRLEIIGGLERMAASNVEPHR